MPRNELWPKESPPKGAQRDNKCYGRRSGHCTLGMARRDSIGEGWEVPAVPGRRGVILGVLRRAGLTVGPGGRRRVGLGSRPETTFNGHLGAYGSGGRLTWGMLHLKNSFSKTQKNAEMQKCKTKSGNPVTPSDTAVKPERRFFCQKNEHTMGGKAAKLNCQRCNCDGTSCNKSYLQCNHLQGGMTEQ